jgi:hypothetical protein
MYRPMRPRDSETLRLFGVSDKASRKWIPCGHTSQSEVDHCRERDGVLLFTLRVVGGSDHDVAHVNVEFSESVPNLKHLSRVGRNQTEVRVPDSSRCLQRGNRIKHVFDSPGNALGRSTRLLRMLVSDVDANLGLVSQRRSLAADGCSNRL